MAPNAIVASLPTDDPLPAVLAELSAREERLEAELAEIQRELRRLRTAADLCALCGGTGQRRRRGGLYGELQVVACSCPAAAPLQR